MALTNDRMAEAMIRAGTTPATIASGERRRSQEARSMVSESDAPSRASQSGAVRVRWDMHTPIYQRATITPNSPHACEGLHIFTHSA